MKIIKYRFKSGGDVVTGYQKGSDVYVFWEDHGEAKQQEVVQKIKNRFPFVAADTDALVSEVTILSETEVKE